MTIDQAIENYQDGQGGRIDILVPLLMGAIGHIGVRMQEAQHSEDGRVALNPAEMALFKCIGAIEQRDPALLLEVEKLSEDSLEDRGDEEEGEAN